MSALRNVVRIWAEYPYLGTFYFLVIPLAVALAGAIMPFSLEGGYRAVLHFLCALIVVWVAAALVFQAGYLDAVTARPLLYAFICVFVGVASGMIALPFAPSP